MPDYSADERIDQEIDRIKDELEPYKPHRTFGSIESAIFYLGREGWKAEGNGIFAHPDGRVGCLEKKNGWIYEFTATPVSEIENALCSAMGRVIRAQEGRV